MVRQVNPSTPGAASRLSAKNAIPSKSTPTWWRSAGTSPSSFALRLVVRVPALVTRAPSLRPVRALLARVPLGPRPWLHRLRCRSPGFVRRLPSYYSGVRPLTIVHHRLRLLAFPMRTTATRVLSPWSTVRSPGSRTKSVCTCQGLRPRRADRALALACPSVLPSALRKTSAPEMRSFSRFNSLACALPCQRFADTLAEADE